MDAATLHDAIAEVCPVVSVAIGDADDRTTWAFAPGAAATTAEIAAGDNVIAMIPVEVLGNVPIADFIARWTNAEYVLLESVRAADIAAGKVGNAKNWDIVMTSVSIDMNKKKVKTLKTDLVADGILTAARADEIFR
jgi:hypothetical protein